MIGDLKEARKKIKKNILPPFGEEWSYHSTIKDIRIEGNSLSFYSSAVGSKYEYDVPLSYAGKTLTLSAKKLMGNNVKIQLSYLVGTAWYGNNAVDAVKVAIPKEAKRILAIIQANGVGHCYVDKIQLEESSIPTSYEERIFTNYKSKDIKLSKKKADKNIFNKDGGTWENKTGGSTFYVPIREYATNSAVRVATMFSTPITPSTRYTTSINRDDISYAIWYMDSEERIVFDSGWLNFTNRSHTFTSRENSYNVAFVFRYLDNRAIKPSDLADLNLQLEEGNKATDYESWKEVNKSKRKELYKKPPFKKYPFEFKRESIKILDGVRYGLNQPRFVNNGLLIEDGEKCNIPITLDRDGGSIEIDFEFASISGQSQYLFDSDSSRWLIHKGSDGSFRVYINGEHIFSFSSSELVVGRNKIMLKWYGSSIDLYVNGLRIKAGTTSKLPSITKIYLGRRYNDVEYLNNAVYGFIVRDSKGKIAYKLFDKPVNPPANDAPIREVKPIGEATIGVDFVIC